MPSPIEDYALLGDCETAALVAKDGSIDWLCWPRFDSSACFSAILGTAEHGRWLIGPVEPPKQVTRQYVGGTMILETEFQTNDGTVVVTDFMPLRQQNSSLIRMVRGRRGKVRMQMELVVRFDFGATVPWVTRMDDGALRAVAGPSMITLRTPAPLEGENLKTVSEFTVSEGETVAFVLTHSPSHLETPPAIDPEAALKQTEKLWREWSGRCIQIGPWAEAVQRSLITLKALTYWPTGGILAAPTTSLPERIGGERNWDYRFCWLRDASFSLWALMSGGYFEEASEWHNWLLRAVAGAPDQVQIMYGLAGERLSPEWEVGWLPGYEKSVPVRIGNGAAAQLQLDLYGEIASALHHARQAGLPGHAPSMDLERALINHLEKIWREPDDGIWEVRGPRRHFTHSKVMAWVAFDRAIKSCEEFGLEGPLDRWRATRQEIHDDVCQNGFDPELGSFVQSYGSKNLDASLLMIAKAGFLPGTDERVIGTVRAIEKNLIRNGLVLRYDTFEAEDGLTPGEGAFLACSFWLADNYVILGRRDDARALFERLLALRNDVGLLSEQYDPRAKRQLGNFPQAFTHVALVISAMRLGSNSKSPLTDGHAART